MARILTETQTIQAEAMATKALDHEQHLLGCALENPLIAARLVTDLTGEDFYHEAHKHIFGVMRSCVERNQRVTLTVVFDRLQRAGALEHVGATYLTDLAQSAPSERGIPYAMERVMEASERRQLLRTARVIAEYALDLEREAPTADAMGALMGVNERRAEEHVRHISEVMQAQVQAIQAAAEALKAGDPPLADTGFHDLDSRIILGPGKLLIAAARPGMGKSAFAAQIAKHVAGIRPVLFATLEMDGEELAARHIASDLKINTHDQAAGRIREEDWERLFALPSAYEAPRLYIDDSPSATMPSIQAAALRVAAKCRSRMGLVVIDYLGLVDGEGRDDTAKTAAISKAAKGMARKLRCPVMLLSQLNRQVEARENKRPQLADLRQSGAIEQDADIVLFLYRDEYYNPETEKKGIAEVIIAKNRGGKANIVSELYWQATATRFENIGFTPAFGAPIIEYSGGGLRDAD